jgi:hypothetical protein
VVEQGDRRSWSVQASLALLSLAPAADCKAPMIMPPLDQSIAEW